MPKISVLMAAYNSAETIGETIDSILNQTFKDFELIIVNDGSTDKTEEIILSYSDSRIKYYPNEKNMKLIYSLNKGLSLAKGKYIARMDSDDIMFPNRLEVQYNFMENNTDVVASGGRVVYFGNKKGIAKLPLTYEEVELFSLLSCQITHPVSIMRRDILVENNLCYKSEYIHAEDFKLWSDFLRYGKLCNLKETLLYYRISEGQITTKYKKEVLETTKKIRRENIEYVLDRLEIELPDKIEKNNFNQFVKKIKKAIILTDSNKIKKQLLLILLFSYMSLDWSVIKCFTKAILSGDLFKFIYYLPKNIIYYRVLISILIKSRWNLYAVNI